MRPWVETRSMRIVIGRGRSPGSALLRGIIEGIKFANVADQGYHLLAASRLSTAERRASLSARPFVPLANPDHHEQLVSLGEVIDVRHAGGGITVQPLHLNLIWRDDHDVRTNMILVRSLAWSSLMRSPRTGPPVPAPRP
jgi:hypothetical protein